MNAPRFQQRRFDAVILDLDGTLVDTLGDFEVALSRSLASLGLPPVTRAFIRNTVGKGMDHLLASTLREVAARSELLGAFRKLYEANYAAVNGQNAEVYAGVREGLSRLDTNGLRMACLTNKPTAMAQALLAKKGLASLFAFTFGGDAFERTKPDPLPVRKTCEALGTLTARTLVIGDSSNDARAARAAGCPVVLLTYGYNHGEPVSTVDANAVADRLDLIDIERL